MRRFSIKKILVVLTLVFVGGMAFARGSIFAADIGAEKCPRAFSAQVGGVDVYFGDFQFLDDGGLFGTGIFSNGYCCPNNTIRLKKNIANNPACQNSSTGEFTWGSQQSNSNFCPEDTVIIGDVGGAKNICQPFFRSYKGEFFLGCKAEQGWDFQKYTDYSAGTIQTASFALGFCTYANAIKAPADHDCICMDGTSDLTATGASCLALCTDINGDGVVDRADVFKDGTSIGGGGALSNDPVGCNTNGTAGPPYDGVLTAIGCIPTEAGELSNWAVLFGMIIGSILSVAKIVQGSIMVMMSSGNPDKLQEGRSIITAALVGLVVILSSVVLLAALGMDVLGLNRLGFAVPGVTP